MDGKFLIQFLKKAENIRLSEAKKKSIREELVLSMLSQPLPSRTSSLERLGGFPHFFIVRRAAFSLTLAGLAVLVSGAGVSLAAEKALPGDMLYPVKTGVNERVRETLAMTPEAKAEWEVRLVERRVAEADELSSEGRLDGDKRQMIETETTRHMENADELAEELDENEHEKADEVREGISHALRSGVRVQAEVLRKKVIISEKEEGIHDEENEPYDDRESDEEERDDQEEDDKRETRVLKPSNRSAVPAVTSETRSADTKKVTTQKKQSSSIETSSQANRTTSSNSKAETSSKNRDADSQDQEEEKEDSSEEQDASQDSEESGDGQEEEH